MQRAHCEDIYIYVYIGSIESAWNDGEQRVCNGVKNQTEHRTRFIRWSRFLSVQLKGYSYDVRS